MDVTSILRRAAQFNADRTAVVADGRVLTFAESWKRGIQLANGILAHGLQPGDRIAVLEHNGLGAADLFLGAAIANVCRAPLYARNQRRSHIQMLNNTQAKMLIVDESMIGDVDQIQSEVPSLEHVFVRNAGYEEWLAAQSDVDPNLKIDPEDLFIIRHTGGTTGDPLAAPLSHRQWYQVSREYFYLFPAPVAGDPILHVGPISHAAGYFFLPLWAAGGSQVMVHDLTPTQVLEVMEQQRIAYMFMPPALLNMVTRVLDVETLDFSSLRCLGIGSAPSSETTLRRAREVFGDVLYQLYGGTEGGVAAGMGPKEWFADVEGSEPLRAAGKMYPWAQVEIRDAAGNPLPIGEPGEIWSQGDSQIVEFLGAPSETSQRIRDGWIFTGDIGKFDKNGYLYLLDRQNDMIISGGYNIYPTELENVIATHPDVLEAAVFGIPHSKWGESPMAVCTVAGSAAVTEEDIIRLVTEQLGSYKKPSRVEIRREPLPRSPVGKLMRRALRDPYWVDRDRPIAGV
jgi:acyl-CoA synthetase (AMP-forming)/AMP-acid ligase II